MFNTLLKGTSSFFAPLLTIILPLQQALIVLLILVLLNYTSQVVLCFKESREYNNFIFRAVASVFSKSALTMLLKRLYEYSMALTMVGLFEVYILNFPINLGERSFSLIHFTVIVSGCLELTRGFQLNKKITGNNMLEIIQGFIPEHLSKLFKNKDSQ